MTLMKIVHINIFSEDNSDENSNTINENGNNEVMVTTMVIVYINVFGKSDNDDKSNCNSENSIY